MAFRKLFQLKMKIYWVMICIWICILWLLINSMPIENDIYSKFIINNKYEATINIEKMDLFLWKLFYFEFFFNAEMAFYKEFCNIHQHWNH